MSSAVSESSIPLIQESQTGSERKKCGKVTALLFWEAAWMTSFIAGNYLMQRYPSTTWQNRVGYYAFSEGLLQMFAGVGAWNMNVKTVVKAVTVFQVVLVGVDVLRTYYPPQ